MPQSYSPFTYLFPGPHLDENGNVDERIRFAVPLGEDDGELVFLIYCYGDEENSMHELRLDKEEVWTA